MARTEYEIVWKKGGWFEKGHFALIPKKSFSDKAGEALVMYIFILVILLLILSIVAVTSPIWIVIIGYQMVREKRYYAGLASLLAIGYFYIDINERWLTSFLFLGYNNSSGEFVNGLFGLKYLHYLEIINPVAAGLGIGYIIDSILVSKYGKKFDDNRITTPQALVYIAPMLLGFVFSNSVQFAKDTEYKPPIINEVVESVQDSEVIEIVKDTFPVQAIETQSQNEIDSANYVYNEQDKVQQALENTDLSKIPSQYEILNRVSKGKPDTWVVRDKDTKKYGIVNKQGKVVLPVEYDRQICCYSIDLLTHKRLLALVKNGKHGIIDINGNIVIDFKYVDLIYMNGGYASCKLSEDGKWGLIDMNGNLIVNFNYDYIMPPRALGYGIDGKSKGFSARKNNLWGYLDFDENILIDFNYTSFGDDFANELIRLDEIEK